MDTKYERSPILLIGNGKLLYSVAACLLEADHPVTLITEEKDRALKNIKGHTFELSKITRRKSKLNQLEILSHPDHKSDHKIAIAVTGENLLEKISMIEQLEKNLPGDSILCINTESISISFLQQTCNYPERLFGVNWTEPAQTTFFLELIINAKTDKELADNLFKLAKDLWGKDPYIVSGDTSIRAKMLSAMTREAFYLVQNGYASIEDIDRACRNDAGYYLPFSGNFRYMDLMGTYAYGLVMKDLNPELAKDAYIPSFLEEITEQGGLGMENNKGFYKYEDGDVKRWNEIFAKFSYQVQDIINKYPFNHKEKFSIADNNTSSY